MSVSGDLQYLAKHVNRWPEAATSVRVDEDGEICFSGKSSEVMNFDFYPDGEVFDNKKWFVESSPGSACGVERSFLEWQAARQQLEDERINNIARNGEATPEEDEEWQGMEERQKQARYQDAKGEDWIDEFARTATAEEFRGAMRFTIGKYNRRMGKKDDLVSEITKMRDYCDRWLEYERAIELETNQ